MDHPIKQLYLVNNKAKEPEFAEAFTSVARSSKLSPTILSALECGFFYSRKQQQSSLYHNGKRLPLSGSAWFLRRWAPSEDASALLALFLQLQHIPVTDSKANSAHEIRTSKLSQTFQLATKGCDCPSTWVVPLQNFNTFKDEIIKTLAFPIIIKGRGGLGARVWKCVSETALKKKIAELKKEARDDLVVCQEYIQNDGDIRVIVFQNKVIAAIERKSTTGFLNNVSQGGTATAITISATERMLAIRAAKAVNLELAGVDIVRSPDGPLVFEVNKAPDISSFDAAVGFNIAEEILSVYIKNLLK
jgi:ribosomal protein S6--L-glutamate ligase